LALDSGVTTATARKNTNGQHSQCKEACNLNSTDTSGINTNVYATQPTKITLFMRTFLPWQLWRFLCINLRMMQVIRLEKRFHK
jgi:hypothetical protein